MLLQPPNPTTNRIEVSGWDLNENFFVQKTDLAWSEEEGKTVYVCHAVRDGAVVFVRPIHPTAAGHTFPIAYQVEHVGPAKESGMWELRLVQLHPRPGTEAQETDTTVAQE